ncbi:hypothetical protein C8N46_10887 [Kordia periserrulae]|uniref:Uncharacterized protein n=1 Tax=Kordia periserrulae TaxID=701523 RepID=A0A2T6BUX0_9FLAO|nr:hypothetical protein [Kordia periserrulae]PTX59777.1 hypothetical protein C8N46_10887 [Kordia periserrulae]
MENTVIINSIGNATPGASKVLSDALKVPQDYILKLLYNAPSILFQKVDKATAEKAEDTLTKLGLDVSICSKDDEIDLTTELIDISVSLDNILMLPKIIEQLAFFLGCKQAEVLNLMLNEPSIVLGNVSVATAKALQKRTDANVHFSNPRKDLYTILISKQAENTQLKNIEKVLKTKATETDTAFVIEDVSYDHSQLLWRQYQANKTVKLLNQSHQLVTIILEDFDVTNEAHTTFLTEKVGMPAEILSDVYEALPISLFENVNNIQASAIMDDCASIGLTTTIEKDFNFKKKLHITEIEDAENVTKILAQFIPEKDLPKANATSWTSNEEVPPLIARYLLAQLEQIECNPEIIN